MRAEEFFMQYLTSIGKENDSRANIFMIDKFGDSPKMADDLLVPVLSGLKTATCSSLWEWEHEGNPIPKPGLLTVIVNGKNEPKCIIETLEVSIIKFNEADSVLAHNEGEGDLSLNYWMQVHEKYFTRTLPLIGKEFSPDMLIVCERFKVVWK